MFILFCPISYNKHRIIEFLMLGFLDKIQGMYLHSLLDYPRCNFRKVTIHILILGHTYFGFEQVCTEINGGSPQEYLTTVYFVNGLSYI